MRKQAIELQIGDKIYPPQREIQLWMNRRLTENNLDESALTLTITDVQQIGGDKRGVWLQVTGLHTPEWLKGYIDPTPERHPFKFKVRPETQWRTV